MKKITLEEKCVANSKTNRVLLKKQLIKAGLLIEECAICGLNSEWNGRKLVMVIDHINGINNDNRLENLRLLCPNCNSQTDTFCGKNIKEKAKERFCNCGRRMHKDSSSCIKCSNRNKQDLRRKFLLSKEDLERLVWLKPMTKLAKELNVSDVTIKKSMKRYGIIGPPVGHWIKK